MSLSLRTTLLICMAFLGIFSIPGCDGCLGEDPVARKKRLEEEKKKKELEKPKPDFEVGRLHIQPRDPSLNQNLVKVGHWMSATQQMKANNFDFKADLEAASTNRGGEPLDLQNTAFRMTASRPATLPKGQTKHFETLYFIPHPPEEGSKTVWLQNKLRARRGGREVTGAMTPTASMPSYTYFFLVLAANPDRYGYLQNMDSIRPPSASDENDMLDNINHYRVIRPKIEDRAPIPSQAMTWTSIAYVLWDGLNPDILTVDQQRAMLDWLHWGGQLIINGPDSLDQLKGSFLHDVLPAESEQAISLDPGAFEELNDKWSLRNSRTKTDERLEVVPDKLPVGVKLKRHPDAESTNSTGGLLVERRIGAGRVVVTAFSLGDRAVTNWGSYDSFFNGALLRRPPRVFSESEQTAYPSVAWLPINGRRPMHTESKYVTRLRYFSRDLPRRVAKANTAPAPPNPWVEDSGQSNVAAWNEVSDVSNAARESLIDAAGISIPKAGFVLRVLAIYLLVLVPANWIIFRVIGRVEWAWVAAPIIAIVGAIAVVRLAQLDIGFARSRTEIAVLECEGGYSRGHLTRYTALYTSLSTGYDLLFDDESALALPFPNKVPYRRGLHESVNTVQFRRDEQVSLSGFQVASNFTGLVHSEQMSDLGGSFQLVGDATAGFRLRNPTEIQIRDAGVLRRTESGILQVAWVGELPPASAKAIDFAEPPDGRAYLQQWRQSTATCSYEEQRDDLLRRLDANNDQVLSVEEASSDPDLVLRFFAVDANQNSQLDVGEIRQYCVDSRDGELTLGRLVDLATESAPLRAGDIRMVGWTDRELPGLTVRPKAAQAMVRTLLLVHLRRGALPPAAPDSNLKANWLVADGLGEPAAGIRARDEGTDPGDESANGNETESPDDSAAGSESDSGQTTPDATTAGTPTRQP